MTQSAPSEFRPRPVPLRVLTTRCIVLIGALLLFACGGCSSPDREGVAASPDESTPRTPNWLRVAVPADPSTSPLDGRRPFQLELWRDVYAALLRLESDASGRSLPVVRPEIAAGWEWRGEETTLLCTLDARRRWSDGTRLGTADVVRSYDFLRARGLLPAGPSGGRARFAEDPADLPRRGGSVLLTVEAVGEDQVLLRFLAGTPSWLAYEVAAQPILPQVEIDLATGVLVPKPGAPLPERVTSGSFTLQRSEDSAEIHLVADSGESGAPAAHVAGVVFEVFPGDLGRVERVYRGECDVALDVLPDALGHRPRDGSDVVVRTDGVGSVELLLWNLARPEIDPVLRTAADLAIDRERIASLFALGETELAVGGGGFLSDRDSSAVSDPAAAAQLLGRADSPSFESVPGRYLTLFYDGSNPLRERIATYLEEDFARVGVVLLPVPLTGPEVFRRYLAGEFEAVLLGFQPPLHPDLSTLFASWGSWNGMGYVSPVVDSLARETYGYEGADLLRLARLLEAEVRRDRPALFLARRQRIDLVRARVQGLGGWPGRPLGSLATVELQP